MKTLKIEIRKTINAFGEEYYELFLNGKYGTSDNNFEAIRRKADLAEKAFLRGTPEPEIIYSKEVKK